MAYSGWRKRLRLRLESLAWALKGRNAYAPSHFYSPIPSHEEVRQALEKGEQAESLPQSLPGIDLNVEGQLELLGRLKPHLLAFDWPETATLPSRYYSPNGMFNMSCGSLLFAIVAEFQPRRYLEVGSGFSSALMLDINDRRTTRQPVELTFIDPYPQRLHKLLNSEEISTTKIIAQTVQTVDIETFDALEANDILFIDSSHVSKAGSDLNYLLLEVVPRLKPGVLVHFHDIYWPFEYPRKWLEEGRYWNEAYLLRAFLMHNADFKVLFFFDQIRKSGLAESLGLPSLHRVGSSLWLQRK